MNYKRNRIEIAPRALLLAAGVVLTVVLISVMVSQFKSAEEMINVSSAVINEKTQDLKDSELTGIDGLEVNGSDVVNVCRKQLGNGINVTLKNGSKSVTYSDSSDISKLKDYESGEYVKPSTKWKCRLVKNKNGIITEIIFTKKGD